jgi:hypothetical protein
MCVPALTILLAIGIGSGHAGGALVATSGAFSVGFGSFQRFTRHKSAPMVLAALGMSLSAALGSLLGRSLPGSVLACALWAIVCACGLRLGIGAWWIGLQWAIALMVAEAFPSGLSGALIRAALVLVGGGLQLLIIAGAWRLHSSPSPAHRVHLRGYFRLARLKFRTSDQPAAYLPRTAAAATTALLVAHWLRMPNAYWAPMTALLVMRPKLQETFSRGIARGTGTLLGAGLASLGAALLRPGPYLTAAFVLVFAWAAYATPRLHYAALSAAITACIVFLLALGGLPEPANAAHRVAATLLGGAIALACALVLPEPGVAHTLARVGTRARPDDVN